MRTIIGRRTLSDLARRLVTGSPARNVSRFTAPVLLFQGTLDASVPAAQASLMEAKMKPVGKRSE